MARPAELALEAILIDLQIADGRVPTLPERKTSAGKELWDRFLFPIPHSFFFPNRMREAWIGDLREDIQMMRSAGWQQSFIAAATVLQVFALSMALLWSLVQNLVHGQLRSHE